jgi:hypothetical protein
MAEAAASLAPCGRMLPHSVEALEEYLRLSEVIAGWTRGNEA